MDIAIIIQSLVAAGGFIAIYYAYKANSNQLKIHNLRLRLEFFADYTKRYQQIMLYLPFDIDKEYFDYNALDKNEKDKILRHMRSYFDLCSEEYYLYLNTHIDNDVWKVWEEGIINSFKNKSYQDAWIIINNKSFYDGKFGCWINSLIDGQPH